MKKIFLIVALMVPSLSFGAQWKTYATSGEGNQVSALDLDSLKEVKPNVFNVWTNLTDKNMKMNTKINNYVDCKNETINSADIYMYKDGKLINSFINETDILSPPGGSVGWQLVQAVCSKSNSTLK